MTVASGELGRIRKPASFALFTYGFRPFFLVAGLHGALSVPLWLALYAGVLPAGALPNPGLWHGHEMTYGFAAAGLAGFLLTAVPSWTSSVPLSGAPLAGLALLWLAGRIAPWILPPAAAGLIDLAFLPALATPVALALIRAGNRRNLMFIPILAALWAGNLMVQAELVLGLPVGRVGEELGIGVLLLMIALIGGRIVPAFTANAHRLAGRDVAMFQHRLVDGLAIASVVLAILLAQTEAAPAAALMAALMNGIRLAGWRPLQARHDPLLAILHVGYGWLAVGFAIQGLAALHEAVPATAALHALTAGCIATMLVAVMSRVALGHTGRRLAAHGATVACYVLLTVAALLRVLQGLAGDWQLAVLLGSAAAWGAAFLLFLIVHAPILIGPRADGRAG